MEFWTIPFGTHLKCPAQGWGQPCHPLASKEECQLSYQPSVGAHLFSLQFSSLWGSASFPAQGTEGVTSYTLSNTDGPQPMTVQRTIFQLYDGVKARTHSVGVIQFAFELVPGLRSGHDALVVLGRARSHSSPPARRHRGR